MAYPPSTLATDRTNTSVIKDQHPQDHNDLAQAVNDIVAELGNSPKGTYLTAQERLDTLETLISTHAIRHHSDGDDPLTYGDIGAASEDHTHVDTQVTLADNYQEVAGTKRFIKDTSTESTIELGTSGDIRLKLIADGSVAWLVDGKFVGKLVGSSTGVAFTPFTAPTTPTYTRASTAYLIDGTLVSSGLPPYEPSNYEYGIMVEEGTSNLFTNPLSQSFSAPWTSGTLNGTYTVSVGSGGSLTLSGGATGTVAAGDSLTFTVSSATVTFTPTGTPLLSQLEAKDYATTWHLGAATRANPVFKIPASVITPSQGTVDIYFKVDDQATTAVDNARLFHIPTTGNYGIYVKHTTDGWNLNVFNESGVGNTSSQVLDTDITNGWHLFTVTWDATAANLYIDGVLQASIDTPTLPSAFSSYMFIGNWSQTVSDAYINGIFDDIRISSAVRPIEEIAQYYLEDTELVTDEITTYKIGMNGSLSTGTTTSFTVGGVNFTTQGASIANASGGTNVDSQARTAINALLAYLRTRGDIAP
jgi:hypothetical protein